MAFALLLTYRSLATVEAVVPLLATGLLLAGVPVRELWFRRLKGETSWPAS